MSNIPVNTREQTGRRPTASKAFAEVVVSASTSATALANPAASATPPTVGVKFTHEFSMARLVFAGTSAANETVNYQVILWRPVKFNETVVWTPQIAAKGVYTLGATALPAAIEATNGLYADTITETLEYAGTRVCSPADDSIAALDIPLCGAQYIQVQTQVATAVKADVICQLGEEFGSFAMSETSIVGSGLATSAKQDTGNAALAKPTAAPATSTAVAAGDATTPATWLAALTTAQFTVPDDCSAVEVAATGTAFTVEVARKDNATWRYAGSFTVPARTPLIIRTSYKALCFGVAGGATVNVDAIRI